MKNPIRSRLNAWLLDKANQTMHEKYGTRKLELFAGLPSLVVEIGPGAGANMRYHKKGATVIAVEPNDKMHKYLKKRAEKNNINLQIKTVCGEHLDLESNSVNAVVSSLVLCSVFDPVNVIAEVYRILRPGGRFIFLEHVAAPADSLLNKFQRLLRRPWAWCAEGCQLNRDTGHMLRQAGFSQLNLEEFRLDTPLLLVSPHISGVAIK